METKGIMFISDLAWYTAVFWYFVGLFTTLLVYAYRSVGSSFNFQKWLFMNRLRIGIGLVLAMLFSAVMFAPDAAYLFTSVLPVQTNFLTPLLIGAGVGGLLIAFFNSKEA